MKKALRRFLDTILLAFCVVLLFRAVVVEPYGVPTGSMAPTLFGLNKAVICPRCGYTVRVGVGGDTDHTAGAFCPNCGCRDLGWDSVPIFSGDHLLVNKNVYDFRSPRRWEMTVFHSPLGDSRNFLKRVVGLPGESVQLHEGDVYVNNELARKTLAELKSLRIPVFDNNYQPAGIGWSQRWLTQPDRGAVPHDGPNLRLEGEGINDAYQWLVYRHTRGISGEESAVADEYAYNGGDRATKAEPVHDFLIECDLEIRSGDGWLALGVNDGGSEIVAELPIGAVREGSHLSEWPLGEGVPLTYRTAPTFALHTGTTYHVEFAFADRRASLAVDGREVFPALDRPPLPTRAAVKRPRGSACAASRSWCGTFGCSATCITPPWDITLRGRLFFWERVSILCWGTTVPTRTTTASGPTVRAVRSRCRRRASGQAVSAAPTQSAAGAASRLGSRPLAAVKVDAHEGQACPLRRSS